MKKEKRTGIQELRLAVSNFSYCNETFLERFTAEQLLQIGRMLLASEWDILPDAWTPRQIREALEGRAPTWDDNERPTYDDKPKNKGSKRS